MTPWTPAAFSGRHQESVLLCRACSCSRVASRALPGSPQPLCIVSGEPHRVPLLPTFPPAAQTYRRPSHSSVQQVCLGVQLGACPRNLARTWHTTRAHCGGVHCSRGRCFISKQERKSYHFFIQIFFLRYIGL